MAYKTFCLSNKELFEQLRCEAPSKTTWVSRKPVWVKVVNKPTFGQCSLCYNFNQKWKSAHEYFKNSCTCSEDDNCMLGEAMGEIKHAGQLLDWFLCPKIPEKFSFNLNCVYGRCEDECGAKSLENLIDSCVTFSLNSHDEDEIEFKEIKTVRRVVCGKLRQQTVRLFETLQFEKFIKVLICDLKIYLKHTAQNRHQKTVKKEIIKQNPPNNTIKLPENSSFTIVDFISNLQIQSLKNCQSQFLTPAQSALCIQAGYQKIDGTPTMTTRAYFCDDPKHDW